MRPSGFSCHFDTHERAPDTVARVVAGRHRNAQPRTLGDLLQVIDELRGYIGCLVAGADNGPPNTALQNQLAHRRSVNGLDIVGIRSAADGARNPSRLRGVAPTAASEDA